MKRLVCCVLAIALFLSGACLGALKDVSESEKAQVLNELEIMQGNERGDLALSRTITRAEFTKLLIAASTYKDAVGGSVATDPYPDVPRAHWAAPWVQMARDTGIVIGRLDGTFHPSDPITLAEGVTMVLRLLGYSDNSNWPVAQLARYDALGMDEGVTAQTRDDALTRGDALHLFYNLLTVKTQAGQPYVNALGYTLNAYGEVDLDAILAENRKGPFIAVEGWQSSLPFSLSDAEITRDGRPTDAAAIAAYDVIYYIESGHKVEAWSDRVTGTVTAVLPNTIAPTAVMVNGQSHPLETREMIAAFEAAGAWRKGDVVTLLLGRTGGVAGVISAHEYGEVTYGVVTAINQAGALDEKGNSFTATTVTIFGTDGVSRSYVWADDNVAVGDLASAQHTETGPMVAKLTTATLTGSYTLAEDAQIIDTYGDTACMTVYPNRLKGVRFADGMVRWHIKNDAGEITDLILKDVTGDLHKYGVVTETKQVAQGMMISGTYTYDSGGIPGVYSGSKLFNVGKGPAQIRSDGVAALKSVSLTAPAGTKSHPLAEQVLYYEKNANGEYIYSSLARLQNGKFTYTGWYDKPESEGGRIRVIVGEQRDSQQ